MARDLPRPKRCVVIVEDSLLTGTVVATRVYFEGKGREEKTGLRNVETGVNLGVIFPHASTVCIGDSIVMMGMNRDERCEEAFIDGNRSERAMRATARVVPICCVRLNCAQKRIGAARGLTLHEHIQSPGRCRGSNTPAYVNGPLQVLL
jgi:hypothetical protein